MTEPSSELRSYMRKQRRHFHRFPEVGLDLPNTHNYIAQELRSAGLEVEQHPSGGVTTTIAGINPDARNVILRADMDALPVVEE
ncbi:MAG: amidohydrolase, partial [Candidatus Nanopelagicales bacterium]|nr:amidohydrolase [Candidatus Nanopelagicales bacterium]